MGAINVPRSDYLRRLREALKVTVLDFRIDLATGPFPGGIPRTGARGYRTCGKSSCPFTRCSDETGPYYISVSTIRCSAFEQPAKSRAHIVYGYSNTANDGGVMSPPASMNYGSYQGYSPYSTAYNSASHRGQPLFASVDLRLYPHIPADRDP